MAKLEPQWESYNLCTCLECDCVFKIHCPHQCCRGKESDIGESESYGR